MEVGQPWRFAAALLRARQRALQLLWNNNGSKAFARDLEDVAQVSGKNSSGEEHAGVARNMPTCDRNGG
jgi:hypothetical protein